MFWSRNAKIRFLRRAAAIVNLCMTMFRCVVNKHSGHLMDLNFSFEHNFLIRCFRGALRRDLIENSFLLKPTECSIQSRRQVLFAAVSCSMLPVPPGIYTSCSMHVSLRCSISRKDFTQRMLKQRQRETK